MKAPFASLSAKLILAAGGTVAVVMAGAIGIFAYAAQSRIETIVFEQAETEAKAVANFINTDIGSAVVAGQNMANSIGALHQAGFHDRQALVAMLKPAVGSTPSIFGSWMAEEPGGLDGTADPKAPGADPRGAFSPYWTKSKNGGLDYSTPQVGYDADWYKIPATTGKSTLTEPFLSAATGLPMLSVAIPVRSDGKLLGLAGFDLTLEGLSKNLAAMRPFGNGRVLLVSGKGTWIASPDPEQRMKPYEDVGKADIAAAIADGRPRVAGVLATGETRIAYPFKVPGVETTWLALVDVPAEVLAAPVRAQVWQLVGGGTVLLALVLGILALAARIVVRKPIGGLLVDVETLAAGNYGRPVNGLDKRDEIGALAVALEGFRHALASGRQAEATAATERGRADAARRESDIERTANADEQARVVEALGGGLASLAAGDLTFRLSDADMKGAYAKIAGDFNAAAAQLESAMAGVSAIVVNINGNTGEISGTAQEMARRVEGQAASIEETSAALDEISRRVDESAQFATAASATVKSACRDAQRSDEVVRQAVEAMRAIESSSKEIGKIIGVIDEIAFQTNLLALNAGVEAARAGEAGRGFAVVATEVRGLAQRSADAARQIKDLISNASREVEEGVDFVERAGGSLRDIAAQVLEIDNKVLAIARGAREQSTGIREVNTAVAHMDQTTQQNAAMLEEAAAASQALRAESDELKALVARFTVSDASTMPHRAQPLRHAA